MSHFPVRTRFIARSILCTVLTLGTLALLHSNAEAQQSFLESEVLIANESFTNLGIKGQWGFKPSFPIYVFAEGSHVSSPQKTRDDANRYQGGAGYEGKRFGGSLHYENVDGLASGYLVTLMGGSLMYRFIPIPKLTDEEEQTMEKEQRLAMRARRKREAESMIPSAALGFALFDLLNFSSTSAALPAFSATRMGISAEVKPRLLRWHVYPLLEYYTYNQDLNTPTVAAFKPYSARSLRLVRLGPRGPLSGIYGTTSDVEQVMSWIRIDSGMSIRAALTRAGSYAPLGSAYSFWFAFDRELGPADSKWFFSPGYEAVLQDSTFYSMLSFTVRIELGERYYPTP